MDRPDFVIIKRKEANRRMRIKMAKETRNSGPAVEDKNSEKPVLTLRGITLEIKAGKQLFFRNRREGGREVQIVSHQLLRHLLFHRLQPWSFFFGFRAPQEALVKKNLSTNAGDEGDAGSILGRGKSPGEGNGNPLQYACRGKPRDRGARWATGHRVAKSWAQQQIYLFLIFIYLAAQVLCGLSGSVMSDSLRPHGL